MKSKIKYSLNEAALSILVRAQLNLENFRPDGPCIEALEGVNFRDDGHVVFSHIGDPGDLEDYERSQGGRVEADLLYNKVNLTDYFDEPADKADFYLFQALKIVKFIQVERERAHVKQDITVVYSTDAFRPAAEFPSQVLRFAGFGEGELTKFYAPIGEFSEAIMLAFITD